MKDQSPYEGMLDRLGGKISLGQVVSIDSKSRTARVRTLGNKDHGNDDQDLQNVKILHHSWNPDGSYAVSMPIVGSYYIVGYVNSEPVLIGAYPLSNTFGAGGRTNQQDLLPGDYAFVTAAGSSLIIRSGGTVEIQSTLGCRTWWLPTHETITTVCQNLEVDTAGGFTHWTVDPDAGTTLLETKAYTDIDAGTAVDLQVGTTSSGAIIDLAVGATDESLSIPSPTLALQVQADGTTTLNVGQGNVTITITPDGKVSISTAADTSLTVGGKTSITSTGDVEVTTQGDAKVTASGDAKVTASGNVDVKGAMIKLNGSVSGVTTMNSHMGVIDLITGAPVQPSTTVLADI